MKPIEASSSAYYRKYALLIAVQEYQDKRIRSVQHAEADVQKLAEALKKHGYDSPEIILSNQATKTTIESRIRKIADRLTENDEFCLFFAGHGFSQAGKNYLTCHDSQNDDLVATSVRLQEQIERIKNSKCKRAIFFLDACGSGIEFPSNERSLLSEFNETELEDFLRNSEYLVCFSACRANEVSQSSSTLGHGVWSHHLIEALDGNAPGAITNARLITASSLQNYLSLEVPRSLRSLFTDAKKQTPWLCGTMNQDFLIADVGPVIAARQTTTPHPPTDVKRVSFQSTDTTAVKSLSGFQKRHHFTPERADGAAQGFIEKISTTEVKDEIESIRQRLRSQFGYNRKDLETTTSPGSGSIITPDFSYFFDVTIDADDPSQVILRRQVTEIRNPQILSDERFEAAFGDSFDTVEFIVTGKIHIQSIIDALEAKKFRPNYPEDCSWCELQLPGSPASIKITPGSIVLTHSTPESPMLLLQSLAQVQQQLAAQIGSKALPLTK